MPTGVLVFVYILTYKRGLADFTAAPFYNSKACSCSCAELLFFDLDVFAERFILHQDSNYGIWIF